MIITDSNALEREHSLDVRTAVSHGPFHLLLVSEIKLRRFIIDKIQRRKFFIDQIQNKPRVHFLKGMRE